MEGSVAVKERDRDRDKEKKRKTRNKVDLQVPFHVANPMNGVTYVLSKKIGQGSYGAIFVAMAHDGPLQFKQVACKVELTEKKLLAKEYLLYQRLNQVSHLFPHVYDSFEVHIGEVSHTFMLMQILGSSLDAMIKGEEFSEGFDMKSICSIGIQAIEALQVLHHLQFVHRDIGPGNLMCQDAHGRRNRIYLIDFGLAVPTPAVNGKQYNPGTLCNSVVGTARYCSKRAHRKGCPLGPRDDLLSLVYVLIYLHKTTLPWANRYKDRNRYLHIGQHKHQTRVKDLCQGLPHKFYAFAHSIDCLRFRETPDYKGYVDLLRDMIIEIQNREALAMEIPQYKDYGYDTSSHTSGHSQMAQGMAQVSDHLLDGRYGGHSRRVHVEDQSAGYDEECSRRGGRGQGEGQGEEEAEEVDEEGEEEEAEEEEEEEMEEDGEEVSEEEEGEEEEEPYDDSESELLLVPENMEDIKEYDESEERAKHRESKEAPRHPPHISHCKTRVSVSVTEEEKSGPERSPALDEANAVEIRQPSITSSVTTVTRDKSSQHNFHLFAKKGKRRFGDCGDLQEMEVFEDCKEVDANLQNRAALGESPTKRLRLKT